MTVIKKIAVIGNASMPLSQQLQSLLLREPVKAFNPKQIKQLIGYQPNLVFVGDGAEQQVSIIKNIEGLTNVIAYTLNPKISAWLEQGVNDVLSLPTTNRALMHYTTQWLDHVAPERNLAEIKSIENMDFDIFKQEQQANRSKKNAKSKKKQQASKPSASTQTTDDQANKQKHPSPKVVSLSSLQSADSIKEATTKANEKDVAPADEQPAKPSEPETDNIEDIDNSLDIEDHWAPVDEPQTDDTDKVTENDAPTSDTAEKASVPDEHLDESKVIPAGVETAEGISLNLGSVGEESTFMPDNDSTTDTSIDLNSGVDDLDQALPDLDLDAALNPESNSEPEDTISLDADTPTTDDTPSEKPSVDDVAESPVDEPDSEESVPADEEAAPEVETAPDTAQSDVAEEPVAPADNPTDDEASDAETATANADTSAIDELNDLISTLAKSDKKYEEPKPKHRVEISAERKAMQKRQALANAEQHQLTKTEIRALIRTYPEDAVKIKQVKKYLAQEADERRREQAAIIALQNKPIEEVMSHFDTPKEKTDAEFQKMVDGLVSVNPDAPIDETPAKNEPEETDETSAESNGTANSPENDNPVKTVKTPAEMENENDTPQADVKQKAEPDSEKAVEEDTESTPAESETVADTQPEQSVNETESDKSKPNPLAGLTPAEREGLLASANVQAGEQQPATPEQLEKQTMPVQHAPAQSVSDSANTDSQTSNIDAGIAGALSGFTAPDTPQTDVHAVPEKPVGKTPAEVAQESETNTEQATPKTLLHFDKDKPVEQPVDKAPAEVAQEQVAELEQPAQQEKPVITPPVEPVKPQSEKVAEQLVNAEQAPQATQNEVKAATPDTATKVAKDTTPATNNKPVDPDSDKVDILTPDTDLPGLGEVDNGLDLLNGELNVKGDDDTEEFFDVPEDDEKKKNKHSGLLSKIFRGKKKHE